MGNRLLDFLGDHPTSDYPITELAENSGVSRPTIYEERPQLEGTGLAEQTRKVGQSRLFKLNTDHPVVREVLTSDIQAVWDEASESGTTAGSAAG